MPVIKVQHVCSFSSEDPNHPTENLLNAETYRKWKCASAGEKQAVVVLQLEKATQIHSVDIGNDGSSFVEVLVGRSSSPDDYQVLVVTSTFMSPADSKAWANTSRVRIFDSHPFHHGSLETELGMRLGQEKLSKGVSDQKWDRVKIVCTQPFNKTEKYGLSFVKLHSPPDSSVEGGSSDAAGEKQPVKLGAFSLREEPKDLPSGSLFFRKEQTNVSSVAAASTAARARMATAAALKADQSDSTEKRTDQSGSSVSLTESKRKTPPPMRSPHHVTTPKTGSKKKPSDTEPRGTPPAKKPKVAEDDTPLAQIMDGVIFALSGFKNPFRGELRGKAVDMGAKYEPDWSPKCTHLVCAFPNTPKFNQVKAKRGLIVKKDWIIDSYIKKRRLPSRKYRLSAGDGGNSSEDDYYDRKEAEFFKKTDSRAGSAATSDPNKTTSSPAKHEPACKTETSKAVVKGVPVGVAKEEEDPYGGSTDEESDMETDIVKEKPLPLDDSSECDTEDEIQRIKQQQKKKEDDPYGGSTEEDSDKDDGSSMTQGATGTRSLTELPTLFSKHRFLLYGSFSPADRRLITRYITAYDGRIEEYMNDKVTHVITQENWDDNFDQALSENSGLAFVRPKWLFMCHQKQLCVPFQPYVVVPT